MIVVGVDENGLGPRLGPLVATAVAIEVERYQAPRLRRVGERLGVHDSKQTGAFGQMAWTESVALACIEHLSGELPQHLDRLLELLSLDSLAHLQTPCPSATRAQCWSDAMTLPAFGGDAAQARPVIHKLARAGVHLRWARTAIACAGQLNAHFESGGTRVSADLGLFERLVIEARRHQPSDVTAICGMVGGIRDYLQYFQHLGPERVRPLPLRKGRCDYVVEGVGELGFVIDADATHLPVGLASMIGKYVRELSVERHNRFYREQDASLTPGSGYHDPVTKRFIAESEPLRRRLQIADRCFLR